MEAFGCVLSSTHVVDALTRVRLLFRARTV